MPHQPPLGTRPIDLLFNPKALTILGASQDQGKLASSRLHALARLGYKGNVFQEGTP